MSKKVAISRNGKNVLTTTDPRDLIYTSEYNTLKYFRSGTVKLSLTGNGSTQNVQKVIAHGLGYIPFFTCFVNTASGLVWFPVPRSEQTAAPNTTTYAGAYADKNNIYLTLQTNRDSPTVVSCIFYYKIFRNNLNMV